MVAVSGGPDSVALLDLLHTLAPDLGLSLVVAHADHGIQADSGTVGQAVAALARRYGLPFELGELRLGSEASETAARRARYAWLAEVQRHRAARYLVTAHHSDDQVETIVLRLLRGSGPAGLAGMPARARGGLVRPLLPFTRRDLVVAVVRGDEIPRRVASLHVGQPRVARAPRGGFGRLRTEVQLSQLERQPVSPHECRDRLGDGTTVRLNPVVRVRDHQRETELGCEGMQQVEQRDRIGPTGHRHHCRSRGGEEAAAGDVGAQAGEQRGHTVV